MLKFIIIPVMGLLLSIGTVFYEGDLQAEVCEQVSETACELVSERQKGYPFTIVEQSGLADQVDSSVLDVNDQEYNFTGVISNFGFWTIVAAVIYFAFTKLRDIVGTIVLAGLGIVAALVYFGILVI